MIGRRHQVLPPRARATDDKPKKVAASTPPVEDSPARYRADAGGPSHRGGARSALASPPPAGVPGGDVCGGARADTDL
jgi:hypothetical protein